MHKAIPFGAGNIDNQSEQHECEYSHAGGCQNKTERENAAVERDASKVERHAAEREGQRQRAELTHALSAGRVLNTECGCERKC